MTQRRIEYAERYFRRLDNIREHISRENAAAAQRVISRIRTAVQQLVITPGIGRPGRVEWTRELVVAGTPYIVPYRIKGDSVQS